MFSFAVKHLSDTAGSGFTASRAMGSADLVGTGMKPVLKKYGIRTSYTVDETNGSEPYDVEAVFPSGTYSALDYTPVRSGYRFAGWSDGTGLPYDSEVEYLESTGTQWIDTGIKGGPGLRLECRGKYKYRATSLVRAGGTVSGTSYSIFLLTGNSQTNIQGAYNSSGPNNLAVNIPFGSWFDAAMENRTLTVNGSTVSSASYTVPELPDNLGIFGFVTNGGTLQITSGVIASVRIFKDGVLARDFQPVRKNGIGYLFDKVSGQLFGNQGSGNFLYGGDVPYTNLSSSDPIRYGLSNVYAVWQPPVVVTFDATTNGGAMPSGWVAPYYYGGQSYGTLPVPTKADNVFLGWFTSLGTRVGTSTKSPYNDHTLVARYAVPTYDTSFEVTTTSSYRKAGIYAANSRNTSNPTIVDWGDGSTSVVYDNISQLVHTYSSNGTFTVRVNNNISSFALSADNSTWYNTTSTNRYTVKKVLSLSSNITSLPTYAFNYCSAMTDALLPSGITAVPNYCFNYCQALKGITIPSNYTSIGQYAFQYCNASAFTSVTIPAAITSIGNYAFSNCRYLNSITFESATATLTLGTYCFQYCFYNSGSVGTIDMSPRKITSIPNYCFRYCYYLKGVIWPQGLTSLGGHAFRYCFYYASATGTVSIPEGITTTNTYTFNGCQYLTEVTIPSTISALKNEFFSSCPRLVKITCNRSTAPTATASSFGSVTGNYTGRNSYSAGTNRLYVPAGATGYTSSYWGSVLLDSTKCGFTLEEMQ